MVQEILSVKVWTGSGAPRLVCITDITIIGFSSTMRNFAMI